MPLDIGVGILFSIGLAHAFAIPLTVPFVAFGIFSTLLPDIDILTALWGTWRHRELTHYPLLYVPICLTAFLIAPFPYALLLTLGVFAHLIHDTFGIGWGIAWLWPFSKRKFLIFPEQARRRVLGTFLTWLPEDENCIRERVYEGASADWVRDFYFRPNLLAFIEYGTLLAALLTLIAYIW